MYREKIPLPLPPGCVEECDAFCVWFEEVCLDDVIVGYVLPALASI